MNEKNKMIMEEYRSQKPEFERLEGEVVSILQDVADKCFETTVFISDQMARIAALIRDNALFADLLHYTHELGMEALCEAHDAEEVKRLLSLGARIIGVNSRDLRTFHTDIRQTGHLLELIPENCAAVAESGISCADDFATLPADAYLIGETLMRAEHPGGKLAELRKGAKACTH